LPPPQIMVMKLNINQKHFLNVDQWAHALYGLYKKIPYTYKMLKDCTSLLDSVHGAVLPTLRFSRDIGLLLMLTCGIFSSVAGCVFLGLFWPLSQVFGLMLFFPSLFRN